MEDSALEERGFGSETAHRQMGVFDLLPSLPQLLVVLALSIIWLLWRQGSLDVHAVKERPTREPILKRSPVG
ncbi:hypothetical protein BaRGS_00029011 [Batillaria attramentaria]|uniref:ATP synthase F0 subunit 8 n=1 Tax=Batillaria attramentaria TaxID=370345 RepID=A0ABD0JX78_9CAEN